MIHQNDQIAAEAKKFFRTLFYQLAVDELIELRLKVSGVALMLVGNADEIC